MTLRNGAVCAIAVFLFCSTSLAAVIKAPDGTGNTTAPSASGITLPYWDAIGQIPRYNSGDGTQNYSLGGTGIYMGNGYVLTAWHIKQYDNPNVIRFGGVEYALDTSSWQQLQDDGGSNADLALVQISGSRPNATPVPYTSIPTSIADGSSVYMMGYGRDRNGGQTTYYIDDGTSPHTLYTTNDPPQDYSVNGFNLSSSKSLRWGTNTIEYHTENFDDGFGINDCIVTYFDSNGDANEAALSNGDSGGPVFYFDSDDSTWKLVGLNIAVANTYTNQGIYRIPYTYNYDPPGPQNSYFNMSVMIDLTQYSFQIVPEPGTMALLGVGGAALLLRRKTRTRAA